MELKTEGHILVKLTITKIAGLTTKVFWMSNRYFLPDELYPGSPEVYGILQSVKGFGQDMGEALPSNKTGTITISCIRGSIDHSRRLYDFTDGYVFLNQEVQCFSLKKPKGAQGLLADRKPEFLGRTVDYSIDIASSSMLISVADPGISLEIVNKRYEVSVVTPSADFKQEQQTINRIAPIVMGRSVQVVGEPYSEYTSSSTWGNFLTSSRFGIGGKLGISGSILGTFNIRSITDSHFSTDNNGVFQTTKLPFAVSSSAPLSSFVGTTNYSRQFHINNVGLSGTENWIFVAYVKLSFADYDDWQITKINIRGTGQADAARVVEGDLILSLGSVINDGAGIVFKEIPGARAKRPKSGVVAGIRGTGNFNLGASAFEEPVRIPDTNNLWLRVEETGLIKDASGDFIGQFRLSQVNGSNVNYVEASAEGGYQRDWGTSGFGNGNPAVLEFFGYGYLAVVNSEPWTTNIIIQYASAAGYSGPSEPSAFDRDWVFVVDGVTDQFTGTITGLSNRLLDRSFDLVKLFFYLQAGESLTTWDETRFPGAKDLSFLISGSITNEITYRQLILELLENSNSKLIPNLDGTYSLWTYGVRQDVLPLVISERDCRLEDISTIGIEDIVNKFTFQYRKSFVEVGSFRIEDDYYRFSVDGIDANSVSLYGERSPDGEFLSSRLIRDQAEAIRYVDYKLIRHGRERQIYSITVPYWMNKNREIQLWDVVQLSHIDNPSHQGSTPPNQTKNLYGDGGADADWSLGFVLRNAKRYFFRVIGREPIFGTTEEAELELTLLILNHPDEVY